MSSKRSIIYFTILIFFIGAAQLKANQYQEGVKRASLFAFYDRLSKIDPFPTQTQSNSEPKIIGGTAAEFETTRHQVSLRLQAVDVLDFGSGHICGGSIIHPNFVVTAAHCVYRMVTAPSPGYVIIDPSEFYIVLGDVYRTQKTDNTVIVKVKRVIPHDLYCPDELLNDIAILEITPSIDVTAVKKNPTDPITLIKLAEKAADAGKVCTVTGWGVTNASAFTSPDILQAVDLELMDHENCKVLYGNQVGPGMLCFMGQYGSKSSCFGDSGGPLVCDGLLHGIVSWGSNTCSGSCSPNVYTKVAYYKDWVERVIEAKVSGASRVVQLNVLILSIAGILHIIW